MPYDNEYEEQEEEGEEFDDLIVSMLQLHTQNRSERIGRKHQESEVYSNQGFNRSGGGADGS